MPSPPSLLLRADGGPGIGAGHLMRCLALAQVAIERGGRAVFLTHLEADSALGRRLRDEGCALEPVGEADEPDDVSSMLRAIERHRPDALVVDGYHFDSAFQTEVHAVTSARSIPLLWVDDEAHAAPYVAERVLNQNPHATPALYARRSTQTRLLLGPRHALLRREFRSRERYEPVEVPVRRILVTLGGGDAGSTTLRLIEALQMAFEDLDPRPRVELVIGALDPRLAELRSVARSAEIELLHDVQNMAEVMARAELALAAAGSTCWELAFMGLPALVVALAENQRPLAREVARHGTAVDLGWHEDLEPRPVARALRALLDDPARRREMSRKGRSWIDGRGAERVLESLLGPVREPSGGGTTMPRQTR